MDPPALINGGSFPGASAPPYNLAEIWPFQLNGGHPTPFGQGNGIGPFGIGSGPNHEALGAGPASLEQRVSLGSGSDSGGGRKRRELEDELAKGGASTSNGAGLSDCDAKRLKPSGDDNGGDGNKPAEEEPGTAKSQPQEPPKQDYIHVRARRGQATDSHSLAER
ncbi:hypothetical protein CRG98_010338, partial [Punica granatum]